MDESRIIYLVVTLLTISFFNLRILRKISEIQCVYRNTYSDVLLRLESVENGLKTLQDSVSSPDSGKDSGVDV